MKEKLNETILHNYRNLVTFFNDLSTTGEVFPFMRESTLNEFL